MIDISKEVQLRVRPIESVFHKINSSDLPRGPERLGESRRTTSILKSDGKLMSLLMPELLGISETVPEWEAKLASYFGSLIAYVHNTLTLEVGHSYTLLDVHRKNEINALVKDALKGNNEIKTDEQLAYYVESNIPYNDRILYGSPINKQDYLVYRIALLHSHVANSVKDVNASPKIRFYLYTEAERVESRKQEAKNIRTILKAQATILGKEGMVEDVLWAYSFILPQGDISAMGADDKMIALDVIAKKNPKWLIEASTDEHIAIKSKIRQYVEIGILYQLPLSESIVDNVEKEKTIGHNLLEVIRYFKDTKNIQQVNAYEMKYKSLVSKKNK